MASTLTLTDFLFARIAEDEAVAAELRDQYPDSGGPSHLSGNWDIVQVTTGYDRVLAECEAKRRIVERHTAPSRDGQYDPECTEDGYGLASPNDCPTLRILAAVYADHEDFRDEWKP